MMMMWMLFAYLGLLPVLLLVLVCGDRPDFEGTWLERVHVFVFGGGCLDSIRNVMSRVCGHSWSASCASVESYCCERPNPFLQLFYLAILGGTYFTIWTTSSQYIPGHYLSGWHRYAGQGAILVGLLLFLMTSFLDPGTMTAASFPRQACNFPFDNILYEKKDCYTCKIPRPARSKHCSICNRCISRFDHHCGWMNNCIGENNLRYFLGFLIWHVLLCWYGMYIVGAILIGEVTEKRVIQAISFYYGHSKREIYAHILQWLLTFYSAQVLVIIFLLVVSLLLCAFAGYHLYLVAKNTTTNETYKWDDYQRWQAEVAWYKIQAEESQRASNGSSEDASKPVGKPGFFAFMFRGRKAYPKKPKPSSFKRNNVYNRGIVANIAEVLYPLSHRTKALQTGSRSKQEKRA